MFLKNVKSKGNVYIYLCAYDPGDQDKKILFSFGRKDKALSVMKNWKIDFSQFPLFLSELGCSKEDLTDWIRIVETGVSKTGKRTKSII
jgi:hypothetical protein